MGIALLIIGPVRAAGSPCPPTGVMLTAPDPKRGLTLERSFDSRDIDLVHAHHRYERTLCRCRVRVGDRGRQHAWCELAWCGDSACGFPTQSCQWGQAEIGQKLPFTSCEVLRDWPSPSDTNNEVDCEQRPPVPLQLLESFGAGGKHFSVSKLPDSVAEWDLCVTLAHKYETNLLIGSSLGTSLRNTENP